MSIPASIARLLILSKLMGCGDISFSIRRATTMSLSYFGRACGLEGRRVCFRELPEEAERFVEDFS